MKNLFILFLFLVSVSASGQSTIAELLKQYNTRSVPYISVQELRMLQVHEKVIVLDSREFHEFEVSHIKTAKHVGYDNFSSEEIVTEIPNKDAPIVVYCSLGIRSEEIGEKLQEAGFTDVQNLYGGIFEWKNKDLPIVNSEGENTEEVHTFSKLWSKWLLKGTKILDQ